MICMASESSESSSCAADFMVSVFVVAHEMARTAHDTIEAERFVICDLPGF
jgi:hypothetical protein